MRLVVTLALAVLPFHGGTTEGRKDVPTPPLSVFPSFRPSVVPSFRLCVLPSFSPSVVVVATTRGELRVPVATELGHAALATPLLQRVLPIEDSIADGWATVAFAGEPFRFLLGAPVMAHANRVVPLTGGAYVTRDTLFVPLQWLAEFVPRTFSEGYRYDAGRARFEEARLAGTTEPAGTDGPARRIASFRPPSDLAERNGFRMQHLVVVDPGHGGIDPGNPGRYLPTGVQEKHVNLAVSKKVRDELVRRGVDAVLTRTTDTLIDLYERAPRCREECDLFVSIHVNSMPPRRGAETVNGLETYFLGEALTAEARRVAELENDALRYDVDIGEMEDPALQWILRDLHQNEFLRESARLATLIQTRGAAVHVGNNRGVSQSGLVVLRTATRPAVLIETGFATNRRDGAYLASAEGQRKLATAIADGIVDYLREYERKVLLEELP